MFDLYDKFGFDAKLAEDGVKLVVGTDKENDYFLVRMLPNTQHTMRLRTLMMAHSDTIDALLETDPEAGLKMDRKFEAEALAGTVLVGFGPGIVDSGEEIKFTEKAAAELLIKYPKVKQLVVAFASDNKNFSAPKPLDKVKVKKQ
jgi:hypothetical protein